MQSRKKSRRIFLAVLIAALLSACGVYFLLPHSLTSRLDAAQTMTLSVVTTGTSVTGKETTDSVLYEFQPDSAEYRALLTLLQDYDFHRNLYSLLPEDSYTPKADTVEYRFATPAQTCTLTDTGDFEVRPTDGNAARYTVGYFGTDKAQTLSAELQGLLKSCTPVTATEE